MINNLDNVYLIAKGGIFECELIFHSGNMKDLFFVNGTGNHILVAVTSLDRYFGDKMYSLFIKLYIEGTELEALKGAEQINRTCKSKLLV